MRKTFIIIGSVILVMGMAAVSCSKKVTGPEEAQPELTTIVLSANQPEQDTKTQLAPLSEGAHVITWKEGDMVSINGNLSTNSVTEAQDGEREVEFTVTGDLTAPYKVLCPATSSENEVRLPDKQEYVEGTFDPAAFPSYGNATKIGDNNYGVQLTPFNTILRFALKGSATLDRIELNALGGQKLYGSFTLATNGSGFTGAFSGGTAGTLTYSMGSGVTLCNTAKYFYVTIPSQTYSSGIEALVYQTDGAFMRLKFWGSGKTISQGARDLYEFDEKTFEAGRTENLVQINSLTAEDGGEPTSERPGITVGVYNIKQNANRSGDNSTYISMDRADVQAGLGSTISGMAADIFGINEVGEDNLPGGTHDIKAWAIAQGLSSSDYTWKMSYPNKVSRSGVLFINYSYSAEMSYANVFAYNKNTITVEDDGYVWLCNKDDDYWSSMEEAYEHGTGSHTAVYAKCCHKVSGMRFWFIVTHFDTYIGNNNGNNLHNVKSFKIFAQYLQNKVENLPIIAVGDLNFGSTKEDKTTGCPNYVELTSYWTDVYDTMYDKHDDAGDLSSWYYYTYNGTQSGSQSSYYYPFIKFTKNHPERRLDHILYKNGNSQNVTPTSYKTIRRTYEAPDPESPDENTAWCPSDHLAVTAYITFD